MYFSSTDVPIVSLQLGSKLNPNDIEEGDDVYFECVVRANPPAYKVVWEHNVRIFSMSFSCNKYCKYYFCSLVISNNIIYILYYNGS